jgi:hypothetical protein
MYPRESSMGNTSKSAFIRYALSSTNKCCHNNVVLSTIFRYRFLVPANDLNFTRMADRICLMNESKVYLKIKTGVASQALFAGRARPEPG